MEGEGGEKKEVRRPMNAFLIFCKRHRSVVREKNPDMDNRSVTRVLGDLWANLGEEKATYTNLAKQYKDAFMKANPNYKWHSSDKSQGSSGKAANKPTNSRIIKNVPELTGDGSITPGKLADPEKMGGLNLLLMADKETRDVRTTPSSLSSVTMAATSNATSVPLSVPATHSSHSDRVETPNSALLQLAEMCTSELNSSGKEIPSGGRVANSQSAPPKSQSVATTSCGPQQPVPSHSPVVHQPMPPPKKRARHWSLTELDGEDGTSNYDDVKDNHAGFAGGSARDSNLSPLNLSMPKQRCILGGPVDDKFTYVEKSKTATGRRRTSSSATESVPSPTMPYVDGMDDADSPVFSPDYSKSEAYAFCSKRNDNKNSYDKSASFPDMVSKSVCLFSEHSSQPSQTSVDNAWSSQKPSEFEKQQRVTPPQHFTPLAEPKKTVQHQLQTSTGGQPQAAVHLPTTRSLLGHRPPSLEDSESQGQPTDHHFSPLPLVPKLESNHKWPTGEIKPEKSNPDFYQWREPGKTKPKTSEAPSSLKFAQSTGDSLTSCKLSMLAQPMSMTSMSNPKQEETLKSLNAKPGRVSVDFASFLSEGRIASLLNSPDMSPFRVSKTEDTHQPGQFVAGKPVGGSGDGTESKELPNVNQKKAELTIPSVKPVSRCPPSFIEGKLKKKWAERSLVEAKMEEDLSQQRDTEHGGSQAVSMAGSSSLSLPSCFRGVDSESKLFSSSSGTTVSAPSHETNTPGMKNHCPPIDSKLFQRSDTTPQIGTQSRLILNQPLDSLKASVGQGSVSLHNDNLSSTMQLSSAQRQLALKGNMAQSNSGFSAVNIKSEKEMSNRTGSFGESKLFATHQEGVGFGQMRNDSDTSITIAESKMGLGKGYNNKGLDIKPTNNNSAMFQNLSDLNQITACGKRIVDHIEQLFKSDFAGEKNMDKSSHIGKVKDPVPSAVKTEPSVGFKQRGQNDSKMDRSIKKEVGQEYKVLTASSLVEKVVREVCGSSAEKSECTSCRRFDQTDTDSQMKEEVPSTVVSDSPQASNRLVHSESSNSFDTYRQASSPTNDVDNQSQQSAQTPESCEQSDHNDDATIQPVRKSRRANRGQKYQELIKEGFIQPSRERMAARNAERQHGRSFGTREEFEKLENRRTLKRSASERDASSLETQSLVAGGGETSNDASDTDKRYTTGDFDLEKEIESLPVCSVDQLGKKKSHRRRCDSETSTSAVRHRSNSDASTMSSSSHVKTSTVIISQGQGSTVPVQVEVQVKESGCPAPHIPIPKEERPAEPVTGSRKRKARRHCITRISVLEEDKSPEVLPKKPCSQPQQPPSLSPSVVDGSKESVRTSESHKDPRALVNKMSAISTSCATKEGVEAAKRMPVPQPSLSLVPQSSASQPISHAIVSQNPASSSPHLSAALGQNTHFSVPASVPLGNPIKEAKKSHTALRKEKKNMQVQNVQLPNSSIAMSFSGSSGFHDTAPRCLWNGKPLLSTPMGNPSSVGESITKSPVNHSVGNAVKMSSSVVSNLLRTPPLTSTHSSMTLAESSMGKIGKQSSMAAVQKKEPKARTPKTQNAEQLSADAPPKKQRKTTKKDQGKKSTEGSTVRKNSKKSSQLAVSSSAQNPQTSTCVKSDSIIQSHFSSVNKASVPSLVSRLFDASVNSPELIKETAHEKKLPELKSPTKVVNLSSHSETVHLPTRVTTINLNDAVTHPHLSSNVPHISSSKLFPSAFPATSTINLASEPRAPLLFQPSFSQSAVNKARVAGDLGSNFPCANVTCNSMVTSSGAVGCGHSKMWSSTKLVPYPSTTLQSSHQNQPVLLSSSATSGTADAGSFTPSLQPSAPLTLSSSQCPTAPSTSNLTTCTPSASTEIVNYTVISSSSVMEASSPHMIGSPHLPESPSVAVV